MNRKTKDRKRTLAALGALASNETGHAKAVERLVNTQLEQVLGARKLKKVKMDRAITSHLKSGLVISGPVSLPKKVAKKRKPGTPLPVGFLVNTMRLVEPISRRALEPSVTLVELRTLRNGDVAFDYIGSDGKVKMASPTHKAHHSGSRRGLSDPSGGGGSDPQQFDIEVNHVIIAPTLDDFLPCDMVCTSYHDGTESCHYACSEDDDLGLAVIG